MRSLARKESEESPKESDRKKLTSVTGVDTTKHGAKITSVRYNGGRK